MCLHACTCTSASCRSTSFASLRTATCARAFSCLCHRTPSILPSDIQLGGHTGMRVHAPLSQRSIAPLHPQVPPGLKPVQHRSPCLRLGLSSTSHRRAWRPWLGHARSRQPSAVEGAAVGPARSSRAGHTLEKGTGAVVGAGLGLAAGVEAGPGRRARSLTTRGRGLKAAGARPGNFPQTRGCCCCRRYCCGRGSALRTGRRSAARARGCHSSSSSSSSSRGTRCGAASVSFWSLSMLCPTARQLWCGSATKSGSTCSQCTPMRGASSAQGSTGTHTIKSSQADDTPARAQLVFL